MVNPYYVEPLGGLDLGQVVSQGVDVYKQRQQQREMEALGQRASQVFETGTPAEQAQFMFDNPQFREQMIAAQGFRNDATRNARLEGIKRILTGEDARTVVPEVAEMIRDAGGSPEQTLALLDRSPEDARTIAFQQLTLLDPKAARAFAERSGRSPGTGTANIQDFEYYQDLKASDPQGAEMFAKDVGLLPKDKQLSATAEKALINSQDQFFKSSTQAREYELLADDFDRFAESLPSGVASSFSEFLKSVTGSQDEASELRRKFAKVRLSEALKYIPPGPATDRDVEEAFRGVPRETSNPKQVKSFLLGAAKMAAVDAEYQEFKSNYISENDSTKGLIKAFKEAAENGEIASINALEPAEEVQEAPQTTITEEESQRGGQIMVDSQGNRAVVFPDGTFREIP